MKAVVHDRYGSPDVLRVTDIAAPEPGPGEVLIRVMATSVNRTDCGFRSATPFIVRAFSGWFRPRQPVLGNEFAGEVVGLGDGVTEFAIGDRVFGADVMGAHAEYLCARASKAIAPMPPSLSFDEAGAIVDGALLGLTCLRVAHVGAGTDLLIYGASGSIGTAAVQIAKHLGANVTAVCDGSSAGLVASLGADTVIDREAIDFTATGATYDVVLDAVGKLSYRRCRRSVRPGGVFADTDLGFMGQNPLLALVTRFVGRRRVRVPIPRMNRADVEYIAGLVESGAYRAVIDRRYGLDDVPEATRYVETERKVGNVVVTVG